MSTWSRGLPPPPSRNCVPYELCSTADSTPRRRPPRTHRGRGAVGGRGRGGGRHHVRGAYRVARRSPARPTTRPGAGRAVRSAVGGAAARARRLPVFLDGEGREAWPSVENVRLGSPFTG